MLIKTKNLKEDIDTKVIDIVSLGEKIIVAKKDVALAKRLDRKAHAVWLKGENSISKADAIWHNAARTIKDEDYWCDKYSIDSWSGVELFDKFATEAGLEFD